MVLEHILEKFDQSKVARDLVKELLQGRKKYFFKNGFGSYWSFLWSYVYKKCESPVLIICRDKEQAAYYLNDLEVIIGKNVLFYPESYRRPYQVQEIDNINVLLRAEVLNNIKNRKKPSLLVTYPDALFEQVITKLDLNSRTFNIHVGDKLDLDFINELLFEYNFKRVDYVVEPGDFSLRGGIVDVFSFSYEKPYRIEFFEDEVESIRTFNIESQLSEKTYQKIQIISNIEQKLKDDKRQHFLQYISDKTLLFCFDFLQVQSRLDALYNKAKEAFNTQTKILEPSSYEALFTSGDTVYKHWSRFRCVHMSSVDNEEAIDLKIKPQPSFNKQFELLIDNLHKNRQEGIESYILCSSEQQVKRFEDIFNDIEKEVSYNAIVAPIFQGFISRELKISCYTDHQIFKRFYKFRLKKGFDKRKSISLKELNTLEVGDFVTHIDHGIGKFEGLQKIKVQGKNQEAIKLVYGDSDVLYISIHSLHKISKYVGKDGKKPKLFKLGSLAWKKLKQKTKTRVKEIAYDLIELYAKRKLQKGFFFAPDSYLQHELEASFIYEDTPDQYKANKDVKADMEKEQPMDRLICGDVGFGKTEVAIRAAFKAVDNNKQVAVLVPTTILAFQHFKTFSERLKDFPVSVDYINRFRNTKDIGQIIQDLKQGKIDILIGTHKITSKSIEFKDLGLLIVDEEQKFGVSVKDKLKTLKSNVDTLTLTATPIPRTLQFSLMAARDISVINTPPPNRHPIDTQSIRLNYEIIRDAIGYEIARDGQVFFIHNRIDTINEVAGILQRLFPDVKIRVGHGQMKGKNLESLMLSFMEKEFDILVSTTIIENGLDVPNANTIFINNANNFGLSDLYQMRGRVGRSNKKAFCYLITPDYEHMSEDARKRIQAIELYSDLGSGLQISMKDLEIRGAGDLLGAEQSGFIGDMGFETYQKILKEAVEELKEKEFKELYKNQYKEKNYVKEVHIDTDMELLIPDDYVSVVSERLKLYNELASIKKEKQLREFKLHLQDRFGLIPTSVLDLLDSVRLKWKAKQMGIEKVILKDDTFIGYFISDKNSQFYQSSVFKRVITFVKNYSNICTLKEKNTKSGLKLLLRVDQYKGISYLIELFNKMEI